MSGDFASLGVEIELSKIVAAQGEFERLAKAAGTVDSSVSQSARRINEQFQQMQDMFRRINDLARQWGAGGIGSAFSGTFRDILGNMMQLRLEAGKFAEVMRASGNTQGLSNMIVLIRNLQSDLREATARAKEFSQANQQHPYMNTGVKWYGGSGAWGSVRPPRDMFSDAEIKGMQDRLQDRMEKAFTAASDHAKRAFYGRMGGGYTMMGLGGKGMSSELTASIDEGVKRQIEGVERLQQVFGRFMTGNNGPGGLFASLTTGWNSLFRAGGIIWAFQQIGMAAQTAISTVRSAASFVIDTVESIQQPAIRMAGALTDTVRNPGQASYQHNKQYAQSMVPMMRLAAAKYGMDEQGVNMATTLIATRGAAPGGNSSDELQKQVDLMTIVLAKVQQMTVGQHQGVQFAQELRAVLEGTTRVSDQFARFMEERIGPSWKQIVLNARESGTLWGTLAEKLVGTQASMNDMEGLVSSRLKTTGETMNQIFSEMFSGLYGQMGSFLKALNTGLKDTLDTMRKEAQYERETAAAVAHTNGPETARNQGIRAKVGKWGSRLSGVPVIGSALSVMGIAADSYSVYNDDEAIAEAARNNYRYTEEGKHRSRSSAYMPEQGLPSALASFSRQFEKGSGALHGVSSGNLSYEDAKLLIEERWGPRITAMDKAIEDAYKAINGGDETGWKVLGKASHYRDLYKKEQQAEIDKIGARDARAGDAAERRSITVDTAYQSILSEIEQAQSALTGDTLAAHIEKINRKWDETGARLRKLAADYKLTAEDASKLNAALGLVGPGGPIRSSESELARREYELQRLQRRQKQLDANAQYGTFDDKDVAQRSKAWLTLQQNIKTAPQGGEEYMEAFVNYAQELADWEKQKAEYAAKGAEELAAMTGNYKGAIAAQEETLRLSERHAKSEEEVLVIREKIARLEAKRTGNVGSLVRYGMQDSSYKAEDDLNNKIGSAMPDFYDQSFSAISGHLVEMATNADKAGEAWKDLQKTISQAILRILADLAMAWAKKQMFGLLGFGNETGGTRATSSIATGVTSGVTDTIRERVLPDAISATGMLDLGTFGAGTSYAPSSGSSVVNLTNLAYSKGHHVEKFSPLFAQGMQSLSDQYYDVTREKLGLTDGFRTYDQQADLYRRKPKLAARPGHSQHELGNAADIKQYSKLNGLIDEGRIQVPEYMEILKDRNKVEPWHWQLKQNYRDNNSEQVKSFGLLGADASQSLGAAGASMGLLGIHFGTSGAASILSKMNTRDGLTGIFMGSSGVESIYNTKNANYWQGAAESRVTKLAGLDTVDSYYAARSTGGTMTSAISDALPSLYKASDGKQYVISSNGSLIAVTQNGTSSTTATTATAEPSATSGIESSDFLDSKSLTSGTSSWTKSLDKWGYENMGIGEQSWEYESDFLAGKAADGVSGGLGSMVGSAISGAGIGYGLSSIVYPNGTGSVGGALGGAAGGVAGSALLGTALGSAAGPIGAVVGGVLGSLLTGSTTSETKKTGSGVTASLIGGKLSYSGYDSYSKTTSGAFGSSSTSHYKSPTIGDPEIEYAFTKAMDEWNRSIKNMAKALNISTQVLKDYTFPFSVDITKDNLEGVAKNIANAETYTLLSSANLLEAFNETAKAGEVYVDQLKRIGEGYSTVGGAMAVAGLSMEKVSGLTGTVYQGNWASLLGESMGSNETAASSFTNTYVKNALSKPQAIDAGLSGSAQMAGQMFASIGDDSLTMDNFWDKYKAALSNGNLSTDQMTNWMQASEWVSSFNDYEKQAITVMKSINDLRIEELQAEMKTIETAKAMVDGTMVSIQSAYSTFSQLNDSLINTLQGIRWSGSLSFNTPTTTYQEQKAYYQQLKDKVEGEDISSVTYTADVQKLISFSSTFLQTSKSYLGNSNAYMMDYNDVTKELEKLQKYTQSETDILRDQLQVQTEQLQAMQAEIDRLDLANTHLSLMSDKISILGSSMDNLGTSLSDAIRSIGGESSWTPNIGAAMEAATTSYTNALASLNETIGSSTTDWSALFAGMTGTTGVSDLYSGSGQIDGLGVSSVTGYMNGGDFGPGRFWTGENGPELITTNTSGHVDSNGRLQELFDTSHLYKAAETGNTIAATGLAGVREEVAAVGDKIDLLTSAVNRAAFAPSRSRA